MAELIQGLLKLGKIMLTHGIYVTTMFEEFRIGSCLRKYADIRWLLESQGQRIDSLDLLIAATALHYNLILVTGNEKHFNRITNLKIENWIKN